MATIDLIVLGILKKEPMGAYDIQKLVVRMKDELEKIKEQSLNIL